MKAERDGGCGELLCGGDGVLHNDLVVFRWLEKQITDKKAITACLLVLQGIACNEELPGGDRQEEI